MKNSKYWKKRFEILEESELKKGQAYLETLEQQYRIASANIEKEISKWYSRFAVNNNISMAEAKKLLSTRELAEFKWDVQEYIKYGQENAFTSQWMKQLENASARVHVSRLEALKLQIQQQVEVLYGNQVDGIEKLAKDIYSDGYYHTAFEIQKGFNVGWDLQSMNESQLQKVLSKPWTVDKNTFRDRCWTNKQQLVGSVQTQMTQSIMRGDPPDRAIKNIAERFNVDKRKAGRLVMTESAFFASTAQKDAFNALDVEQFEIVATLDNHTSEICQELDGHVFDMKDYESGVTAPPFHPWCRTTTVPYFDDEFGERAARDADGKTYYVPSDMKYKDWKEAFVDGGSKDGFKEISIDDIIKGKPKLFNTTAEAFKNVKYTGIEEKFAKQIDERFLELSNEYPIDTQDIIIKGLKVDGEFGHFQGQINIIKNNTLGFKHEIVISNSNMFDFETSKRKHEFTAKNRGSKNISALATIDHEYAHAIDSAFALKKNTKLKSDMMVWVGKEFSGSLDAKIINNLNRELHTSADRLSVKIYEQMRTDYKMNNLDFLKKVKDEFGSYAASSTSEFLAEGFSAYRHIPKDDQSDFLKLFGKYFDDYFSEVF